MNKATFDRYCNFLYREMDSFCGKKLEEARAGVFKLYTEKLLRVPDENGILDVDISFDCSWMKRGHKSHVGIGLLSK